MSTPIVLLSSLASIAMLWVWLFWLYRDLYVEWFRQQMFALRDRLFDDAARGAIAFDHPAYGMIRTTMNGFIRYAHILNLAHFILIAVRPPERAIESSFEKRFQKIMEDLDDQQRALFFTYMSEVNKLVLRYVLLGSPVLFGTLLIPIAFYLIIRNFTGWLLALLRSPLDEVDSIALAAGDG